MVETQFDVCLCDTNTKSIVNVEKIIKNVYIVVVGWLVGWFVVEMKKKRDPVYPSQSNVFITTTTTTITKYDVEKGSITF